MFGFPLRKTDQVDLIKPLSQYIKANFSKEVLEQHKDAVKHFQQLRDEFRQVTERNESTRNLYASYYALLCSVERRFPFGDNPSSRAIRVQLTWYDAFARKKVYAYSVDFERLSVLFNLAALCSQLGELQVRQTVDGVRRACVFFQSSAGFLDMLGEAVTARPAAAVTPDLSPDFACAMGAFMRAQAQECYVEKAFFDGVSDGSLRRLAQGCSDLFSQADGALRIHPLKGYIESRYADVAALKSRYFGALARQRDGAVRRVDSRFGEELAQLRAASLLLGGEETAKLLKTTTAPFQQWFGRLSTSVSGALATAERENSTIYHDSVPPSLPAPEGLVLAKAVRESLTLDGAQDPFARLVPLEVLTTASVYAERKAELLRGSLSRLKNLDELARASLHSMGLPEALQAAQFSRVPPQVADRARRVGASGGLARLLDALEAGETRAARARRALAEAEALLDAEEREDAEMQRRAESSSSFSPSSSSMTTTPMGAPSRQRSHLVNGGLREMGAKYAAHARQAEKSDAMARERVETHQAALWALSGGETALAEALPLGGAGKKNPAANGGDGGGNGGNGGNDGGNDGGKAAAAATLQRLLGELDALVARRRRLRAELTRVAEGDDIAGVLLNSGAPAEAVFAQELRKYDPLLAQIEGNEIEQRQLFDRISDANAAFVREKQQNDADAERVAALQRLDRAYEAFVELSRQAEEAEKFYAQFEDLVAGYVDKCRDFVFTRRNEMKFLEQQLSRPPPSASSSHPHEYF